MSKVICDVCGTAYPDTAAQCPICNSAKSSADTTAAGGSGDSSASYAYVKGGRFSKKNVKKRGKTTAQRRSSRQQPNQQEPSNTGLVIVVILLLLAIVAVLIYIGVHFFGPSDDGSSTAGSSGSQTESQTQEQTQTQPSTTLASGVACEQLKLSNQIVELTEQGETLTLVVAVSPVDCTDEVFFVSTDESVATVSSNGVITAVGGGEATIIVTCGDIGAGCKVICSFEDPTESVEATDPSENTQPSESVTPGEFDFRWNTGYVDDKGVGDVSLSKQGSTWTAYKSSLSIDVSLITWTSDDESVCTVENGVVTAVGHGTTKIHATYNGVTYDCIIRCPFAETAPANTEATEATEATENTEVTENTGAAEGTTEKCVINKTDVTIKVGESFTLTLKDSSGNVLDVQWEASGDGVTIDGNTITGAASGKVTVSVTYGGETYSCIVRVTG